MRRCPRTLSMGRAKDAVTEVFIAGIHSAVDPSPQARSYSNVIFVVWGRHVCSFFEGREKMCDLASISERSLRELQRRELEECMKQLWRPKSV